MKIRESTETEFDELTGGGVMSEYVAIVCGSTAVSWLATEDKSIAGVVRRDRDGDEITYSWGCYRGAEFVGYSTDIESEHDALMACAARMLEAGR
jgi:hypothetical protein